MGLFWATGRLSHSIVEVKKQISILYFYSSPCYISFFIHAMLSTLYSPLVCSAWPIFIYTSVTLLSNLLGCLLRKAKQRIPFFQSTARLIRISPRSSTWILLHSRRSGPRAFMGWFLWQMTLQESTVHTNKIRLHWIELKQTLERADLLMGHCL